MVWSDPEIQKLSQHFVTVADEAYGLYPENPAHRERIKDRPDFVFFKKFGESMPAGDWNPGTKQGIYMIGPNAEYLEGRFAASGEPQDIRQRLLRAMSRWEELRKAKGYANKPIPKHTWSPPSEIRGELILRVNSRDLPRSPGDKSGARRHEIPESGMWRDFTKWAWNENWVGIAKAKDLVPGSDGVESVNIEAVHSIARKALIDNVRGQTPEWTESEVKRAAISMRFVNGKEIEYRGDVLLESSGRSLAAKIYGRGTWTGNKFSDLNIVAMGTRRGATRFNQRESDPGPAPIGVTLSLSRQ